MRLVLFLLLAIVAIPAQADFFTYPASMTLHHTCADAQCTFPLMIVAKK